MADQELKKLAKDMIKTIRLGNVAMAVDRDLSGRLETRLSQERLLDYLELVLDTIFEKE